MTAQNGTTMVGPSVAMARVREEHTAIEPQNMGELRALAEAAAKSNFYGAKTPEQGLMILVAGRDLGLSYAQSLRAFHIIENKPVLSADGMAAVCLGHRDVCEYFRVIDATDKQATVAVKRVGDPERRLTFTMDDAARAKLVKPGSGWEKYPSRMLLARAKAFAAREVFPDLLLGIYEPDEIRDSVEEPRRVDVVPVERASSPTVTPEPSTAAQAFVVACAHVQNDDELQALRQAIQDANLSDEDKKHVAKAYNARKAALKAGK